MNGRLNDDIETVLENGDDLLDINRGDDLVVYLGNDAALDNSDTGGHLQITELNTSNESVEVSADASSTSKQTRSADTGNDKPNLFTDFDTKCSVQSQNSAFEGNQKTSDRKLVVISGPKSQHRIPDIPNMPQEAARQEPAVFTSTAIFCP